MLVLSRRIGESLVIGDDVVLTVLEIRGDVIRLGVDAPRHVAIHRKELLEQLAASNREAASPDEAAVAGLSRLVAARVDPRTAGEPAPGPTSEPSSGPTATPAGRPAADPRGSR